LSQLKKSNGNGRASSFEALMSLDFASMQSMEDIPTAGIIKKTVDKPHVNWSGDTKSEVPSTSAVPGVPLLAKTGENIGDQAARLGSILRSLSQDSMQKKAVEMAAGGNAGAQGAEQQQLGVNSTFVARGGVPDMYRVPSGTGLTALRELQGLNQRNSSVDDFLSLVASGDIPAQDPQLLNLPLQSLISNVHKNPSQQNLAALHQLQQQILAQQARLGQNANGAATVTATAAATNPGMQVPAAPLPLARAGLAGAPGTAPLPGNAMQMQHYQHQFQKMQHTFFLQQQQQNAQLQMYQKQMHQIQQQQQQQYEKHHQQLKEHMQKTEQQQQQPPSQDKPQQLIQQQQTTEQQPQQEVPPSAQAGQTNEQPGLKRKAGDAEPSDEAPAMKKERADPTEESGVKPTPISAPSTNETS